MNPVASDYFCVTVTSVFDAYFQDLGAIREPSDRLDCVRYSTKDWIAEILYLPSDGPRYAPRVEIGCRENKFIDPRRNRIDIMHTAPKNSEEYDYNLRWRYESREQLAKVLEDVRDRVLNIFALQFLRNTELLKALLKERHDTVEAEWKSQLDEHNDSIQRREAEAAFESENYERVIECYSKIPDERQSRVDQSKLQIAKVRVCSPS